ncbi:MAG TPA: extensin family protein [Labilithrix sp.]
MRRIAIALVLAGCTQSHVAGTNAPPPPSAPAPAEAAPEVVAPIEETPPPPIVPAPKLRRPGAYANLDPDDDYVVGPPDALDDCDDQLAKAGVKFSRATLAVHEQKKGHFLCGAPQVVTYLRGPGNIAYSAPPLLTCGMALALAQFEKILQEESQAILKSKVARIDQLGTYNCREMLMYKGWVSEHSYANAIDLGRFVLADGRAVEVLRDFDVGDDTPKKPVGAFLRVVSRRANDEDVFSHVLTPFFDALHKNHFHLDLARYRSDGTRPQQI